MLTGLAAIGDEQAIKEAMTLGRFPTDQGFDEWYGIANSHDEIYWATPEDATAQTSERLPYILEAKRGQAPRRVRLYDNVPVGAGDDYAPPKDAVWPGKSR